MGKAFISATPMQAARVAAVKASRYNVKIFFDRGFPVNEIAGNFVFNALTATQWYFPLKV